jgi:LmbE family N-acetylglucosaminyl deacetylase
MSATQGDEDYGADRWAGIRSALPSLEPPAAGSRLLVVAAHPDDETLGAGGLLAEAEAHGAAITVVVATDGDASHPRSPTHRPRDLASVRRREVYAALAMLAPSAEVVMLGLPDGRLAGHEDELREQLTPLVQAATLVATPWIQDRHPDHEACARAVAGLPGARSHWQYPIWAWHWDDPASPRFPRHALHALPLGGKTQAAKGRAIDCFPSQCAPLSDQPGDETVLAPGMLAHFRTGAEVFVVS